MLKDFRDHSCDLLGKFAFRIDESMNRGYGRAKLRELTLPNVKSFAARMTKDSLDSDPVRTRTSCGAAISIIQSFRDTTE